MEKNTVINTFLSLIHILLLQSSTKLVYCLDSTFCELHISLSFAISGG